ASTWTRADHMAHYTGVLAERLRLLVKQARIPSPSYHLGPTQPRWERLALDAAFEGKERQRDAQAVAQEVADDILRQAAHWGRRQRGRVHLPAAGTRPSGRESC